MYLVYIDGVVLPVTPGKIDLKIKNRNETVVLINGQEIDLLKAPGLTQISFSALLPAHQMPYCNDGYQKPDAYLAQWEAIKVGRKPVQLIITRDYPNGEEYFDTNLQVALEDYTIKESAEEGMDLVVDLNFKQFVNYQTILLSTAKESGQTAKVTATKKRASTKIAPKTYTVKSGDTLWAICKKELGDGNHYKEIAAKNNIANPNRIYPRQVISLG